MLLAVGERWNTIARNKRGERIQEGEKQRLHEYANSLINTREKKSAKIAVSQMYRTDVPP